MISKKKIKVNALGLEEISKEKKKRIKNIDCKRQILKVTRKRRYVKNERIVFVNQINV